MTLIHTVSFNPANQSAFGTLETAELTPVIQLDFVYGINTQTGTATVANSATVDTNAARLRLQTGTNSAGSAIFQSKRIAKYRAGQGIVARFTPIFTTGVASSTQLMGAGDATNGYFFGYNGTAFGILHRNGGVDTWTARTSWNGDKVDGSAGSSFTWNPTFGTPVQIKYPYLGYGNINFYVQNPDTSTWVLVHTIKYANTTATTQLTIPNLSFYAQVLNAGNTSNLIAYCGSVGFFISGIRNFVSGPRWALDNNKASITTETCLLNIRNATTYNGVANKTLLRLQSVSFAAANGSNAIGVMRFRIGATIGGSPSWTTVNGTTAYSGVTITSGNSVVSYDTAGTTSTGGTYIYNLSVAQASALVVDLSQYEFFVAPGEILTIAGFSTVSTSLGVSINWTEDI